jgi:excisionase family DNA binding protein
MPSDPQTIPALPPADDLPADPATAPAAARKRAPRPRKRPTYPADFAALISPKHAAEMLAISLSTLYDLQGRGAFGPTGIRLGRAVRFDRAELLDWARAGAPSREKWQQLRRQTGGNHA